MEWTFDPLEIKNAYLNIEKLGAILQAPALADGEHLVSREVDVEGSRPPQYIAPGVTERPQLG